TDRVSNRDGNLVIYRPQLPTPTHRILGNSATPSRPSVAPARSSASSTTPSRLAANSAQESYPAGSLVLHGSSQAPAQKTVLSPSLTFSWRPPPNAVPAQTAAPVNSGNTYAYGQTAWQQAAPAEASQNNYTVVNGFARPNFENHVTLQSTPSQNQGTSVHVIEGHYTAAQHLSGSSSPYKVYSTGGGNYEAPRNERAAGNNSYIIPGHYAVSERLNSSSSSASSGRGTESSRGSRNSGEEHGAESHSHYESHQESHSPSEWSHGSSSSSSSSGSSSSHASSGGSSGGNSSSGRR
ncbi:MAG TPA: hypothetical protein VFB72_15085, partial [Verrucomicrobiae bacterium]|nr:hypothetical protein [Verrucomicrobiae bacterium]